jgi:hypothetical protein
MRLWLAALVLLGCSSPERSGSGSGSGPGSGTGSESGSGTGSESGSGSESGTATESGTGSESGSESGTATESASNPASTDDRPPSADACQAAKFATELALPEASGAVWVEASFGLPAHIVVVSDSGNRGSFAVIDAASGAELASGNLPIDKKVSDDLEGFARAGGTYYALTSGGYMRHYRRTGADRFELAVPGYPLTGATCDSPRRGNCGHDFEGLCLADPLPASGCAGFAASRRSGELVCLQAGAGGRLRPDLGQTIRVALPMTLSDCNIGKSGALYAATNGFGANSLIRVAGWREPSKARALPLRGHATGFIEAVAAGPGGEIVRLSDSGGRTSAMFLDSCPRAGPE